jgi:hypothetical protein
MNLENLCQSPDGLVKGAEEGVEVAIGKNSGTN